MFVLVQLVVFIVFTCKASFGQHEDASCIRSNGENGICIPIFGCDFALAQLQEKIAPQTCGFNKNKPLVCCPRAGIKSKKYCGSFYGFDYAGEFSLLFAVGGENSLAKEFPHMAILGYGEQNAIQWSCGGSLINEQYVLTAAHCLFSRDLGYVKYVRIGDLNINITTDDAEPQDFQVDSMFRHPEYKPPSRYHDIALLKLDRPVKFTEYVKPICLGTYVDLNGTAPTATGWGKLGFTGETSPHLQKVFLSHFTLEECKIAYASVPVRQLTYSIDDQTQLCAGGRDVERDTCQGDSGGPLQIRHKKYPAIYSQIGITSFGKACGLANIPGVYTRVSYYVPWIEGIAWPND